MENSNLETVVEKLFSTKSVSDKMNDEIKNQVSRNKEALFRRIQSSQYEGQEEQLSDDDYQNVDTDVKVEQTANKIMEGM